MFFFQYFVQSGVFFVVPLFLSVSLGLSAIDTGVRLLPLSITLLIAAIGIPRFFPDVSPRRVVRLGAARDVPRRRGAARRDRRGRDGEHRPRPAAPAGPRHRRARLPARERHGVVGARRAEPRGRRAPEHGDEPRHLARDRARRLGAGRGAHRDASSRGSRTTRTSRRGSTSRRRRSSPAGSRSSRTPTCARRSTMPTSRRRPRTRSSRRTATPAWPRFRPRSESSRWSRCSVSSARAGSRGRSRNPRRRSSSSIPRSSSSELEDRRRMDRAVVEVDVRDVREGRCRRACPGCHRPSWMWPKACSRSRSSSASRSASVVGADVKAVHREVAVPERRAVRDEDVDVVAGSRPRPRRDRPRPS